MRRIFVLFLLCVIFLAGCSSRPEEADEVVRLHIIANSDSEEDQAVKLKVRDDILKYMRTWDTVTDKEEALEGIKGNTEEFEVIANRILENEDTGYTAVAEVGSFSFPAKQYGSKWYPAGEYDALRVTLGKGQGQNWWCVMFPPLCLMDVSFVDEQELQNVGGASLIMEDMPVVSYQSKILEWVDSLFGGE